MRKALSLFGIVISTVFVVGCSSSDSTAQDPPKGMRPDTVNAPPGAKNPEERGREAEKAMNPPAAGKDPNQDGGGQDGK